ncbi:MAG TPA: FG-GAP-like repeat-containing protein [Candidatus Binatia bacterium]|nr:FG-GAP-like repeat-containing protein [Candidatus Binatia bacterium]
MSHTNVAISLVVGDFNGDGTLDLAEVNNTPSTGEVEILMGNGDGTFTAGPSYVFGIFPLYAAAASLRRNGILDLVINDKLNDEVWVLLGNGDGTFQPAVSYPTTAASYMAGVGDFTGDGIPDIVAIEGSDVNGINCSCVEVLPGNGDGTFGSPITTTLPDGLTAYEFTIGDFNNDGLLDVAATGESYPSFEVAILLGNGNGTFTADGGYPVSPVPTSIAAGLFTTNKATLDLAEVSGEDSSLNILLGNGEGAFRQSVYYGLSFPGGIVAADFTDSGRDDLAVTYFRFPSESGVAIYRSKGDGAFQADGSYSVDAGFLASGDFNGDGKVDLVGEGGNPGYVTILLNTGVVSFSPTTPLNFKKQAVGTTSAAQNVTLTNTGTTALKIQSIKASTEFAVTSTCGERVAAGAKCTISATFSPTKQGAVQGAISIIDNASSKAQVIELLGTGT